MVQATPRAPEGLRYDQAVPEVPSSLRGVLFDWDGTLVDSAEASYRSYERVFAGYGIAFDRVRFEATYSPNWHLTYQALGLPRDAWAEADARWLVHYASEPSRLLPGAREILGRLRDAGLALAVVTSGDRGRVTGELSRLGLTAWFDSLTCAGDTLQRKPDPEPLRLGLNRLGLAALCAAYVGDSPEDVEMARAAGVFAVGVPGRFPNRAALAAARPDVLAPDLAAAGDTLLARAGAGSGAA
jgi:HAD superfamily hydrolase (TIGR01549 family)